MSGWRWRISPASPISTNGCSTAFSHETLGGHAERFMLSLAEISHATYGAWRLALFDAGGMRYFDRSLEGFWRSFRVALLLAPGAILLAWLDLADGHAHGGWFRIGAGEVITYVLSWT